MLRRMKLRGAMRWMNIDIEYIDIVDEYRHVRFRMLCSDTGGWKGSGHEC